MPSKSATSSESVSSKARTAFERLPILSEIIASQALGEKLREEFLALFDSDRAESTASSAKDALTSSIKHLSQVRREPSGLAEELKCAEQQRENAETIVVDSEALSKNAKRTLIDLAPVVESMVKKHYRTTSVTVHPDRHGEESRERFELLKRAASVLEKAELRHKYYRDLLGVITKLPSMICFSHGLWMEEHAPGAIMVKKAGRTKAAAKTMMRITEGGADELKPWTPSLLSWGSRATNEEHIATIQVALTHQSLWENLKKLHIQLFDWDALESGWQDQEPIAACNLFEDIEINVRVDVGGFGSYQVRWRIEMIDLGDSMARFSQWSNPLDLNHFDPKAIALDRAKHEAHQNLVWHKSTLSYAISFFERSFELKDGSAQTQASTRLRNESDKCLRLINRYEGFAKKSSGPIKSSIVNEMRSLHRRASHLLQECDAVEAMMVKKGTQRRFNTDVMLLLGGNAAGWLGDSTTLSTESIAEMGGTPNRLYQILVDRRKGSLGSRAYKVAAARDDLFTAKQCSKLLSLAGAHEDLVAIDGAHGNDFETQNPTNSSNLIKSNQKASRRYVRRGIKILFDSHASFLSQRERVALALVSKVAYEALNHLGTTFARSMLGSTLLATVDKSCESRRLEASVPLEDKNADSRVLSNSAKSNVALVDAECKIKALQQQLSQAEEARMRAERAREQAELELYRFRNTSANVSMSDLQPLTEEHMRSLARTISCESSHSTRPQATELLEVCSLFFTQDSIAARFQDDRPVIDLVNDLLAGRVDARRHENLVLDVVCFKGTYRCLNNRRLWALKEYEKRLNHQASRGKHSLKQVRVRVRIFSLCPMTAKFLLANTSNNNGLATRMRSLSRAPRCVSQDTHARSNVSSYRQRSHSRQPKDSIHKDDSAGGARSLSRKPSVRISEFVDEHESKIANESSARHRNVQDACHGDIPLNSSVPRPSLPNSPCKTKWEVYSEPSTGRHWWWNPVEQRATFINPHRA